MKTLPPTGFLETTVCHNIATIEFGHPSSNALPIALLKQLAQAINSLSTHKTVVVIILKSSGTGPFCAGASFDELLAVSNITDATQFFSGFACVLNAMRNCSKIILGRIQGKAVGGALGIIAACDYAMATAASAIKLSELTIGIGPFVIEPAVSRKIGKTATAQLSLEAQWKEASWAADKGLYDQIFETTNDLDNAIETLANTVINYHPDALIQLKKVLWEGTENWNTLLYERAKISGELILSDFSKEALHKFKKPH